MIASFESYRYLIRPIDTVGNDRTLDVGDCNNFNCFLNSLLLIGLTVKQSDDILRVLAGVLFLGNIDFDNSEATNILEDSVIELARLCSDIWMVDEERYLIDRINEAFHEKKKEMSENEEIKKFIGVLDIYGFEVLDRNSFEQFCINFANEKLHQNFNECMFTEEQKDYEKEKIEWAPVIYSDNGSVINLFEGPTGLINLLNEQSRRLNGSDLDWLSQMSNCLDLKKNTNLVLPRVQSHDFIVRHYASEVRYSIHGFVEKNTDTVGDQILSVMSSSGSELMRKLVESEIASSKTVVLKHGINPIKKTVVSKFVDSLRELMEVLSSTRSHFIMCIKPNADKSRGYIERKRFQNLRKVTIGIQSIHRANRVRIAVEKLKNSAFKIQTQQNEEKREKLHVNF